MPNGDQFMYGTFEYQRTLIGYNLDVMIKRESIITNDLKFLTIVAHSSVLSEPSSKRPTHVPLRLILYKTKIKRIYK